MICDPAANVVFISDLLEPRFPQLVDRLRCILAKYEIPLRIIGGTKDIWCRDYMPVQVAPGRYVKFCYSPDYLVGYEDTITNFEEIDPIPEIVSCEQSDVVPDGGNVVRWGNRAIVTNKVLRENRWVRRDILLPLLRRLLEVDEVIVIPHEPGDVIGNADGMVRFMDAETVFVKDYSEVAPSYVRRLLSVLRRAGLEWIELPYCPEADVKDGIPSAVGFYANVLMVRGLIVLPTFGISKDNTAKQVLFERAEHQAIESVDCSDLAREGGVLNCVTWTIVSS